MQKTIIIQGTGIAQVTVCDLCGKESGLQQFEGWRRFINYRQGLRQDICRECLQACLTTACTLTWGILPRNKHYSPPKRIPPKGSYLQPPHAGKASR